MNQSEIYQEILREHNQSQKFVLIHLKTGKLIYLDIEDLEIEL